MAADSKGFNESIPMTDYPPPTFTAAVGLPDYTAGPSHIPDSTQTRLVNR